MTVITVITIPPLVNWMLIHFLGQGTTLQLPFLQTVVQIALLTIVPVALGMWCGRIVLSLPPKPTSR